MELFLQI